MSKNVTIYKGDSYYNLPMLTAPLLLLVPLFEGGMPLERGRLFGYILLSSISILLALAPRGFKLEVGDDYVKTYFLGFCLREIRASRVQAVVSGNLFRGGLGYGKGLKGWELQENGRSKYFSMGEKAYGSEGIAHTKRVLRSQIKNAATTESV